MHSKLFRLGVPLVAAVLVSACAHRSHVQNAPVYSPGGYGAAYPAQGGYGNYSQYGRVANIELVRAQSRTSGGGALLGGVVGALVGRQFGNSSSGRATGTWAGAVGGVLIGNEIEKNRSGAQDLVRVSVQLDEGGMRAFDYAQIGELRIGDRVRVEGNQVYRL